MAELAQGRASAIREATLKEDLDGWSVVLMRFHEPAGRSDCGGNVHSTVD